MRITDEQLLIFEIAKLDNRLNEVIGRQGDGYQKTVDVQLLSNGNSYDLTLTAVIGFKGIKPDGSTVVDYDHAKITDAVNGKFTYSFPSGCFSVPGDYSDAYFNVVGYDGTVDSTNSFEIKVIENLVDQTVVTGDYLSPIDKIVDYGKKKINAVSDTLDNLVASTKKTIDDLITTSTTKINDFINASNQKLGDMLNQSKKDLDAAKKANSDELTEFKKAAASQLADSVKRENNALNKFNIDSADQIAQSKKDWQMLMDQSKKASQSVLDTFEEQTKVLINRANNLKIGGTNLILNSAQIIDVDDSANHSKGWKYLDLYKGLVQGREYVFSTNVNVVDGTTKQIQISTYDFKNQKPDVTQICTIDGDGKITAYIKPTIAGTDLVIYAGIATNTHDNHIKIDHYKLEKGNVMTDWSPAPEDLLPKFTIEKVKETD